MSAVGITESAKGDHKKFEVWCNSRDEVFIVQVRGRFYLDLHHIAHKLLTVLLVGLSSMKY